MGGLGATTKKHWPGTKSKGTIFFHCTINTYEIYFLGGTRKKEREIQKILLPQECQKSYLEASEEKTYFIQKCCILKINGRPFYKTFWSMATRCNFLACKEPHIQFKALRDQIETCLWSTKLFLNPKNGGMDDLKSDLEGHLRSLYTYLCSEAS